LQKREVSHQAAEPRAQRRPGAVDRKCCRWLKTQDDAIVVAAARPSLCVIGNGLPSLRVASAAKEMVMPPQPLATRVERLEQRMAALEELPARVEALESQIVQLRGEMHGEFAALRMDMRAGDEETRRVLREELGGEIKAMGDRVEAAIQEARDHSRVMFEEVIERISRIGEGSSRRPRRKS
jgi:hypothetical protein